MKCRAALLLICIFIHFKHSYLTDIQNKPTIHIDSSVLSMLQAYSSNIPLDPNHLQSIYKNCSQTQQWGALATPVNHLPAPYIYFAPSLCHAKVDLFIAVCSHPSAIKQRHLIRHTWGALRHHLNYRIILGFFLGATGENDAQLRLEIARENLRYGDIVQSDHVENMRNSTMKHLGIYKWILQYCSQAKYLLKTNDNVIVDVYHAIYVLHKHRPHHFYCKLIVTGMRIPKDLYPDYIWSVTNEEFPDDNYPHYCDGFGYLLDVTKLRDIYWCSLFTKYFWVDDVYITGIIAGRVGVQHQDFLEGHSYTELEPVPTEDNVRNSVFLISNNNAVFPDFYQQTWSTILRQRIKQGLLY